MSACVQVNRLSEFGSKRMFYAFSLIKCLQRLAQHCKNDPNFNWYSFARFVANEMRAFEPGRYLLKGRKRATGWPTLSAATVLCYGSEPVFSSVDDVPPHILSLVTAGIDAEVAEAVASDRQRAKAPDKLERAEAFGVDAATKLRLKLWHGFACTDMTDAEWRKFLQSNRNARRRAKRARPHANSVERLKPWEVVGISRSAFYRLPKSEQERLIELALARETEMVTPNNNSICTDQISLSLAEAVCAETTAATGPQAANADATQAGAADVIEAISSHENAATACTSPNALAERARLGDLRIAPNSDGKLWVHLPLLRSEITLNLNPDATAISLGPEQRQIFALAILDQVHMAVM